MAEVTAAMVKSSRERTGAGMMDCKEALVEADGDMDKAEDWLRARALARGQQGRTRSTNEGIVDAYIHHAGGTKIGVLVELNCETDFVAQTDDFKELAQELAMQVVGASAEYVRREDVPPTSSSASAPSTASRCKGKPENSRSRRSSTGKLESLLRADLPARAAVDHGRQEEGRRAGDRGDRQARREHRGGPLRPVQVGESVDDDGATRQRRVSLGATNVELADVWTAPATGAAGLRPSHPQALRRSPAGRRRHTASTRRRRSASPSRSRNRRARRPDRRSSSAAATSSAAWRPAQHGHGPRHRRLHGHAGDRHQRAGPAGRARARRRRRPACRRRSRCAQVAEPFIRRRAIRHLEKGRVVIFAAGTGNPLLHHRHRRRAARGGDRAPTSSCKATKVDGIYTADPIKVPTPRVLDAHLHGRAQPRPRRHGHHRHHPLHGQQCRSSSSTSSRDGQHRARDHGRPDRYPRRCRGDRPMSEREKAEDPSDRLRDACRRRKRMEKSVEALHRDLMTIRTGTRIARAARASPGRLLRGADTAPEPCRDHAPEASLL